MVIPALCLLITEVGINCIDLFTEVGINCIKLFTEVGINCIKLFYQNKNLTDHFTDRPSQKNLNDSQRLSVSFFQVNMYDTNDHQCSNRVRQLAGRYTHAEFSTERQPPSSRTGVEYDGPLSTFVRLLACSKLDHGTKRETSFVDRHARSYGPNST